MCILLFLIRTLQLASSRNESLPLASLCFDVKVQNCKGKVKTVRKVLLVGPGVFSCNHSCVEPRRKVMHLKQNVFASQPLNCFTKYNQMKRGNYHLQPWECGTSVQFAFNKALPLKIRIVVIFKKRMKLLHLCVPTTLFHILLLFTCVIFPWPHLYKTHKNFLSLLCTKIPFSSCFFSKIICGCTQCLICVVMGQQVLRTVRGAVRRQMLRLLSSRRMPSDEKGRT